MPKPKLIRIKNTNYYAQRRVEERQIITIIGELPEGWDSPKERITIEARKSLQTGVWGAVSINWPAIGPQSLAVTQEFVRLMRWATQEAKRIEEETLMQIVEAGEPWRSR